MRAVVTMRLLDFVPFGSNPSYYLLHDAWCGVPSFLFSLWTARRSFQPLHSFRISLITRGVVRLAMMARVGHLLW